MIMKTKSFVFLVEKSTELVAGARTMLYPGFESVIFQFPTSFQSELTEPFQVYVSAKTLKFKITKRVKILTKIFFPTNDFFTLTPKK